MRRNSLARQKDGVGGFFLDIPLFILVLVVLTIFTTSLYHLSDSNRKEETRMELEDKTIGLKNDIQDYEKILFERENTFSIEKLERIEDETIEEELLSHENYRSNVSFHDHERGFERSFGTDLPDENAERKISTYTTPVSMICPNGVDEIGTIEVRVWED